MGMSEKPHKLLTVTLPPDWIAACRAAAAASGLTLSAWVGRAVRRGMPPEVRRGLSEPHRVGRPPQQG